MKFKKWERDAYQVRNNQTSWIHQHDLSNSIRTSYHHLLQEISDLNNLILAPKCTYIIGDMHELKDTVCRIQHITHESKIEESG